MKVPLFNIRELAEPDAVSGNQNAAHIAASLQKLPIFLLTEMLVGAYLFLLLSMMSTDWTLVLWFLLISVVVLSKGLLFYFICRASEPLKSLKSRMRYLLAGSASSGIAWSSIWLLLPGTSDNQATGILTMAQCIVLFAAIASLSGHMGSLLLFAVLPVASSLVHLFVFSGESGIYLGSGYALCVGILMLFPTFLNEKIASASEREPVETDAANSADEKVTHLPQHRDIRSYFDINQSLTASAKENLPLLQSIEEGILLVDTQGRISFANPSACKALGFEDEELIGKKLMDLIRRIGGNADIFVETVTAVSASYLQGIGSTGRQSELLSKSGISIPVRYSCGPVAISGDIIGAIVSFTNISEQREMEAMLIQSQKLEALGRISGAVAHDFNNLLTVISGNLQFLKKQPGLSDVMQELINKIMTASMSGSDLVSRLLGFSKKQQLQLATHGINELLSDIEHFLARILGESITLEIQYHETNLPVLTDKTQFQNAIFNLCLNAKDAMSRGGKLSITPRLQSEYEPGIALQRPGRRYLELAVQDTGHGMDRDVQEHIFEPFFTTKSADKGSGLGLSTVYGFIKQSGGAITVDSEPDVGTVFRLYLPLSTTELSASTDTKTADSDVVFSGTILVVEDDDEVRDVAITILLNSGYEVISARDGQSGLDQFKNHPEIDLVFTDIVMPGGMSGIDLAIAIHKERPDAPVLLTTGYTGDSLNEKIPDQKHISLVVKPFDADELPRTIHALISEGAS